MLLNLLGLSPITTFPLMSIIFEAAKDIQYFGEHALKLEREKLFGVSYDARE